MDIQEALFKLDDFCRKNNIEYIVTGTTALSMLGIPSNPGDIDIKINLPSKEQKEKLEELQFLSSTNNDPTYEDKCYSFIVGGIKINAIVCNIENCKKITIKLFGKEYDVHEHLINVQPVIFALSDKMNLRREKDKTYMLNLIGNLARL